LKHLQSETKELKRLGVYNYNFRCEATQANALSLVDQLLNDHCKALCHSLTTMMYEKLPRELRLMIYDYFINEMLSEIGLSRTSAVYYRSDNFWKAIWREPRGYIWRASWVGHKVANEAVGYAYSQITFNMNFPEQINNFLLKPHDVFGREVDPKHYIRKLEFYIYYNKQVGIDGYRATGAKTIHDDEGIKKLRETQVTTLEELLKVAQPKGFKLLLLVRASHGSASTYTQAVETLKGLGPTIYKLKGAGFEVSILQRYQSGWANEDLFAGWLDGSFEDWETRIDERLLQLQNEGIVSG
jgi:hypothetical protein